MEKMSDTSEAIYKKQLEIYLSKTLQERFQMMADMADFGVNQTKAVIRKQYPEMTELEVKLTFFEWYYRDYFSEAQMQKWLKIIAEKE